MPRRKSTATPADHTADIDTDALARAAAARDEVAAHAARVADQLGVTEPYNLERSIVICVQMREAVSQGLLEIGRQLLLIKEHEPHGDFRSIVEDRIGIPYNTARRCMQAVSKFLDGTARRRLANQLDKSKLLELMTEEDEQLDALAEGGTIAGMTLDDVERMTARELREALRDARKSREEEKEATDKLLLAKDRKLNELSRALDKKTNAPWHVIAKAIGDDAYVLAGDAMAAIERFQLHLNKLHEEPLVEQADGQRAVARVLSHLGACIADETQELIDELHGRVEPLAARFMPETEEGRDLVRTFDAYMGESPEEPQE